MILSPKTFFYSFIVIFPQHHGKDYNKMQYNASSEDEGVYKEG